ncbi:MAG: ATP-grasp domain-containing protein, partial [Actinomycetota bacterium]
HDKLKTVRLARDLGVPVPQTVELDAVAGDLRGVGAELGWPIVVKPRHALRPRHQRAELSGVRYASDEPALARAAELDAGPLLLQSFCTGEGRAIGALASGGRVVAAFEHRRVREFPITGGPSSCRVGVALEADLFDWTERLVAALHWTGLIMVEFRVGPRGPRLMEINGRTWGSLPLAVKSGVDFPRHVVDLCLGRNLPTAPAPYRVGTVSRNLELELRWALGVLRGPAFEHHRTPPRLEALPVLARALWPWSGYDMASRDDRAPALAEIRRVARMVVADSWDRRPRRRSADPAPAR